MQIIANRAPIGFEAEFMNQRGENICYRGILMPFSSDGDAIDFIYGVINWKTVGDTAAGASASGDYIPLGDIDELLLEEQAHQEPVEQPVATEEAGAEEPVSTEEAIAEEPAAIEPTFDEPIVAEEPGEIDEPAAVEPAEPTGEEHPTWEEGPSADPEPEPADIAPEQTPQPVHFAWQDGSVADAEQDEIAELVLDENAGLADRLWAARETAESVKAGEGRTRVSLYRALALAYDFALASQQNPDEYAELLEESGVKAQARAPMTPIVKLVFGVDYDKARLTEFAAALSYAQRQDIGLGAFKDFIEKQPGGLKALVAAERQARRPEPKADTQGEAARAKLRAARPISLADVPAGEEFAVVVTRRGPDGSHEPVAILDDEALIERAIRRAA
jgi:hypothetical protein